MKRTRNLRLMALTLTAALALTALTACGRDPGAAQTAGAPAQTVSPAPETAPAPVGTVLLSVNPEIEMDYDQDGNVVALTARNGDGQAVLAGYTGYEGRPCTAVIGELVSQINAAGYFDATIDGHEKNIVLKLEQGSAYPTDRFLDDLATSVRIAVEADQIGSQPVTLDQDDYDDTYTAQGYINAAAAQNILSAQLGRDDLQFVEKDYDLDDGKYEVEFILDGVEYEYEVNAVTGKVTEVDIDTQDDALDDRYDDGWDDRYDDGWDDRYDDDWDDRYDDDWDDRYDDGWDDQYDDDWDDRYDDDWDDRYDDDWDDQYDDDWDDQYDDDWDDQYDDDWDDDDDDDDDWDD